MGASVLAATTAGPVGAQRDSQDRAVVAWIDRHAHGLASTDPRGPLDELERDLAPIRPRGSRLEHQQWYFQRSDSEKRQLIDHARRANQLVDGLAAIGPRLDREYARQHARTILGWYETFANTGFQSERERFIADTVTWWQRTIGGKIAYWAANVHAAAAPTVTLRVAGQPSTCMRGHLARSRTGAAGR